ncbi:ABC transporter ATP-binding protein [Pseudobacteriovorax antillogorgiicola]|uniref:ATP-binding cassette, subfamily B n=1 Tax=Pseudobacteriovorax antillogorgiicola TaxID=1513793 RepID=A0A1Y6BNN7_9BACT|nr:ABC transporter ATP-binding protein [Pseudobacteriovorax antillogorgiicola]TCS53864.1 ATP-binding cassette subfamily B protein [Pseudobacteriovorax antillogorgiicola]SMF21407.1 ATP-binding cassette, subfamily B [Pseudobacteriovorax antillogorgiicola]
MLTLSSFARRFALNLWPWYLVGTIFLAATNLITLEIPQLAKRIVNGLNDVSSSQDQLIQFAVAIVLLGGLQILARSLSRILIFWPGRKLEATSKSALFGKAMTLPQLFLERFGMGDLISRLSNDLSQVRVFFAFAVLQILNLAFLSVFTIFKMLGAHIQLTLMCLIPIALMLVITQFIMPRLARYSRENQEAIGSLTNRVTEAFTNVHVIQSNGAEQTFQDRVDEENEKVYATNMNVVTFRTLFFPLLTSLTGVSQMMVIAYGGLQVFQGEITVGDLLAFNIYLAYLAFPLTSLGIVLSIYQRSKTAIERLSPIDEEPSESAGEAQSTHDESILLRIQDLSYRYPRQEGNERAVLEDINLEVRDGEKIGICGSVGSGKSTLFNLITRIYDPPPGTIFWKGRDVVGISPRDLRQDIAYALQSAQLFSASISENLKFGIAKAPDQNELQRAAQAAQIYEDITEFDRAWETQIGEKGVRLSGGQKQRLALARLFLRNPPLLLLDDVLSAVDNHTEAQLISYLDRQKQSMIISSHRTSVLRSCDRVLLLDRGRIIDQGDFDFLAAKHPHIKEDTHES